MSILETTAAPVTTPATPARRRPWALAAARVAVPAAVLLLWLAAAPGTDLVPSLPATLVELRAGFTEGWIYDGLRATAAAVAQGFMLGTLVAFPTGYVIGRSRTLHRIFEPLVAGTFAVPRVIFYPVMLTLFGIGLEAKTAMIAISSFFPILMSVTAAVRQVSPTLLKLGRSLSAGRLQTATRIVVPAAAPAIMVGIRIGFSISFIAAIIAEFFAAKAGLGLLISRAYAQLDLPRMYAVILLVMTAAFAGNMLLWWAERRLRSD